MGRMFARMVWLGMSCTIFVLSLTMLVGQLVMAGGWQWWAWIMLAMVGLAACLVKLAWNEYKQSKQ